MNTTAISLTIRIWHAVLEQTSPTDQNSMLKRFESSPGSSAVVPSRGTNEGAADAVTPDGIRKEAALARTVLQGVGRGGALEDGKKAGGGCAGGDAKDRRRRQRRR
jgi:hypothetical protein